MTLKLRLLVLLVIMLAALGGGLLVLRAVHREEEREERAKLLAQRAALLERVLPLLGEPLEQFTRDYSLWDEMVAFLETRDPGWARVNLGPSLATFRLSAVWVWRADGTEVYSAGRDKAGERPRLAAEARERLLAALRVKPFRALHFREGRRVYALQCAPVQPSEDYGRTATPSGWLLAARQMDGDFLNTVSELTEARADVLEAGPEGAGADRMVVDRVLPGLDGEPVGVLRLAFREPLTTASANRDELLLMAGQNLCLIALAIGCVWLWVLKPFDAIGRSLVSGDPAPLGPLEGRATELGHIARLIQIHFSHQKTLARTLEERDRLARDLHDGVIQSIYAAGMGVAAARSMIRTDPKAAEEDLERIRSALNDTIREARGFIDGLEASGAPEEVFSTAVRLQVESLKWIRRVETAVRIDDAVAGRLAPAARAELLQLIREAASNSLRHAQAARLEITLGERDGAAELVVADNGRGFDAGKGNARGHGLENFRERAQAAGGSLRIDSRPGEGTRITVTMPFPSAQP